MSNVLRNSLVDGIQLGNRVQKMTEAHAVLKFARVAPRKARPVIDLIRGRQVSMALAILKHTPRHAAKVVEKLVRSAVANAELKEMGDSESMVISKAFVNCGPTYKRVRARSMGRANAIQKRTSHITVVVTAPEIQGKRK